VARTPAPPSPSPARVEAAPTTATLRVEADIPGATVFLDRVGVGTAPLSLPGLTPGSHRLNVSAEGYETYGETLDLEPGLRTVTIAFREIRLDVSLAAVHKHGLGSCRGRLSATPAGLRYEAGDGRDSFTVALTDLAAFELDYLDTNLRVRTREGRTFNFTDPDGHADRLFVFHRDVERARQRVTGERP
jgi:hypothetical protein